MYIWFIYMCVYTYIHTCVYIICWACLWLGSRYRTPEMNPSEIIVDFSGAFQWMCSWHFQHHFTCRRYFPKGCHFPSGFYWKCPMDLSGIFQWTFPVTFCEFWCAIFCPDWSSSNRSVNKNTLLRRRRRVGVQAFSAPNRDPESSNTI